MTKSMQWNRSALEMIIDLYRFRSYGKLTFQWRLNTLQAPTMFCEQEDKILKGPLYLLVVQWEDFLWSLMALRAIKKMKK